MERQQSTRNGGSALPTQTRDVASEKLETMPWDSSFLKPPGENFLIEEADSLILTSGARRTPLASVKPNIPSKSSVAGTHEGTLEWDHVILHDDINVADWLTDTEASNAPHLPRVMTTEATTSARTVSGCISEKVASENERKSSGEAGSRGAAADISRPTSSRTPSKDVRSHQEMPQGASKVRVPGPGRLQKVSAGSRPPKVPSASISCPTTKPSTAALGQGQLQPTKKKSKAFVQPVWNSPLKK